MTREVKLDLTLCWFFLYAGMMRTELGVDFELCGVSSCDVSQQLKINLHGPL